MCGGPRGSTKVEFFCGFFYPEIAGRSRFWDRIWLDLMNVIPISHGWQKWHPFLKVGIQTFDVQTSSALFGLEVHASVSGQFWGIFWVKGSEFWMISHLLIFTPNLGEMIQFDSYFQFGWNQQLENDGLQKWADKVCLVCGLKYD